MFIVNDNVVVVSLAEFTRIFYNDSTTNKRENLAHTSRESSSTIKTYSLQEILCRNGPSTLFQQWASYTGTKT